MFSPKSVEEEFEPSRPPNMLEVSTCTESSLLFVTKYEQGCHATFYVAGNKLIVVSARAKAQPGVEKHFASSGRPSNAQACLMLRLLVHGVKLMKAWPGTSLVEP